MQEMVRTSEEAYSRNDTSRGIWYPLPYAGVLQETGQKEKYEELREKGDLVVGHAPEEFFEPVYDRIGGVVKRRDWSFLVRKEKLPSDALKAAMFGPTILDCGAACQLARYKALLDVLGERKFNRLFSEPHGQRMNIGYRDAPDQPMQYFVRFSGAAKRVEEWAREGKCLKKFPSVFERRLVKVGQVVSFNGVEVYMQKHPSGMGKNYNAICLNDKFGQQRYVAHGFPSEGKTEEEICLHLVRSYNAEPDFYTRVPDRGTEQIRQRAQAAEPFRRRKISEKNPASKVKGFDLGSPQEFCVELIADLVKLPLEQVSMAYVKNHPKANREAMLSLTDLATRLFKLLSERKDLQK